MLHSRKYILRFVIVALLFGLLAVSGMMVARQVGTYTGVVYRCERPPAGACARQPLGNQKVYLLSGYGDPSSPAVILQATYSDETGHFGFVGAPPGAVAAVYVGHYRPNTWIGNTDEKPYCVFALQGAQFHDIEIQTDDFYRAAIGDFGELYPSVKVCPPTLR
jgi:hypothetical protein